MSRKITRTALVLVAMLTVPAVLFAAPLPASAQGDHLVETFGNYFVGAPSLALYAPVVETSSGRSINIHSNGDGGYEIVFNYDTSKCVAGANNGADVVIHPCNGGSGIIWFLSTDGNGNLFFQNKKFSTYLAGANNGGQFQLKPKPLSGWYEKFTLL
jgi:hypothetical protein